jgi:hypothetical protein
MPPLYGWRRIRVVLIRLVSLAGAVVAAILPTLGPLSQSGRLTVWVC